MNNNSYTPEAATGNLKLAATVTDKKGYGQHWQFSTRKIDDLLAQGLPHLKIGKRRVRIIVEEADVWMHERFSTQRRGPALTSATAAAK
jgi:hypothetical protein